MTESDDRITTNPLSFGHYRQHWWGHLIAAAFVMGEVGAGLVVLSLLTGFHEALLVGWLVVIVGKNTAHIMYLGRPERFWKVMKRPDRSWIARGFWATAILGVGGAFLLLPVFLGGAWTIPDLLFYPVAGITLLAALFIMFYDGLIMSTPRSVPLWNSYFVPTLCFSYGALGGVTLWMVISNYYAAPSVEPLTPLLADPTLLTGAIGELKIFLILANLVLVGYYLVTMSKREGTPQNNVEMLVRGRYRTVFLGVVLSIGLVATLIFAILHYTTHVRLWLIVIAATELVGEFALLYMLLQSGLYRVQTSPGLSEQQYRHID